MVLKLLIVILALRVLDTSTQYLNRIPLDGMDLYRFGFSKDNDKRQEKVPEEMQENTIIIDKPAQLCRVGTHCIPGEKPKNGSSFQTKREDIKSAIRAFEERMELLNLLRSLPREEMSDPEIFVPVELDYRTEN